VLRSLQPSAGRFVLEHQLPRNKEAGRAEPPLESTVRSARELNCRERLLTAKEAANFLHLSESWLAKGRMRGDGPPYVKLGRAIRYSEDALVQWMKSRQRLSTSDR
jgi:predicted DNA-binding transcriptional regulator AlpA